ncbi:hypothetical protein B0H14DRAFT_3136485 [Mycena olivaceomarginata]|nr:hypothetical protein B0H14DRAFT_3136485 [Mycena olivaceomarginata]
MSGFSNDAFLQRMRAVAQNRPTITPVPARKRTRHERDGTSSAVASDDERDEPTMGMRAFAKKQKLRGEQLTQVDTFLNDTPTVREGKLFALVLGLQNDVANIIVAAPAFSVSPELQTNIKSYALAVMLSPKLAQYRGDLPVQHVMNILKKHRFDMPPGIENNPADMQKIMAAVQYAFTQDRSSLKKRLKLLFSSVRVTRLDATGTRVAVDLPPGQHQNLFGLAQAFVEGTKCRITNALCGRIALMRDVYLQNSTSSFWVSLDEALAAMRTAAEGNDEACDAMFEDLINMDKTLHGAVDIVYQATNNIQQEVDDLIVAGRGRAEGVDVGSPDPTDDPTPVPEGNGTEGGEDDEPNER